jgi:uncharacterized repeat protein (TIGR01451 family)
MVKLWLVAGLAILALALFTLGTPPAASAGVLALTDTPSPTAPTATETASPTPVTPTPTNPAPTDPPTATATSPSSTEAVPGGPSPAGNVVVTKFSNVAAVSIGGRLEYTLLVSNLGLAEAQNVVVTDALAPELDFLSAATTQGAQAYDPEMRTVTFELGSLAPGQAATLAIVTQVNRHATVAGEIRNVAQVSTGVDSNVNLVVVIPDEMPLTGLGPSLADWLRLLALVAVVGLAAAGAVAVLRLRLR